MSLLDEELVEQWLHTQHFFTVRGIRSGVDEIDLLAIRQTETGLEAWHVEVQVSFRPVGYICGDGSARKRDAEVLEAAVSGWIGKKFTSERKVAKRNEFLTGGTWRYVFVCARAREQRELEIMQDHGIVVVPYRQVLEDLRLSSRHQASSLANGIVEILRFQSEAD